VFVWKGSKLSRGVILKAEAAKRVWALGRLGARVLLSNHHDATGSLSYLLTPPLLFARATALAAVRNTGTKGSPRHRISPAIANLITVL
jgi:hypothetical protein